MNREGSRVRAGLAQTAAELRTCWAHRIFERGDSAELARLLFIAERNAFRAQGDILALDRALTGSGALSAASRVPFVQDHIDALLRDSERLRSLESAGSWPQIETVNLICPLLHHLARQLHSLSRTFLNSRNAQPSRPGNEYLHENAELSRLTTCLIRSLVEWGRKSSRYHRWEDQVTQGIGEAFTIPTQT